MAEKIMVVDDDEGYLLAVRRLLEAEGYRVVTACSAADARARLQSEIPDLILLDVLMPGEDGFAFSDELADTERVAGVPVILVTAVAESSGQVMYALERDKGLAVADILPKSAAHVRLIETVRAALTKGEGRSPSEHRP